MCVCTSTQAPAYIPPPTPSVEEEVLDWELSSIVRSSLDLPGKEPEQPCKSLRMGADAGACAEFVSTSEGEITAPRCEQQGQCQGMGPSVVSLSEQRQNLGPVTQGLKSEPHHEELTDTGMMDTGIVYEKVDRGSSDDDDSD